MRIDNGLLIASGVTVILTVFFSPNWFILTLSDKFDPVWCLLKLEVKVSAKEFLWRVLRGEDGEDPKVFPDSFSGEVHVAVDLMTVCKKIFSS